MKSPDLLGSTIWNYLRLGIRLGSGLVLFRMYYTRLDEQTFGFWALLWTIFGCGVLLDFGFGLAVQRGVAHHGSRNEWQPLNSVVTNSFFLFCVIGLGIFTLSILSGTWISGTSVFIDEERKSEFTRAIQIFGAGMGLSLPLSIFQEVLRGLQEIALLNKIIIFGSILNFAVQGWLLQNGGGIIPLVAGATGVIVCQHLLTWWCCVRYYRRLSIKFRYFNTGTIVESARFGLFGYIILLTYMIVTKTDQLILGAMAGLTTVALYQPALKAGELFGVLTRQVAENLQPAAAHYASLGRKDQIRRLLLDGVRWSGLLATPLLLIFLGSLKPILSLMTGESAIDFSVWLSGIFLLVWGYGFVLSHNVFKRIMIMCDKHRYLMRLGVAEAVLNVVLSIVFLQYTGNMAAVALGTMTASFLIGWGPLWSRATREAGMPGHQLFQESIAPGIICQLPAIPGVIAWNTFASASNYPHMLTIAGSGVIAGAVFLPMVWKFGIREEEKENLRSRYGKLSTRAAGESRNRMKGI